MPKRTTVRIEIYLTVVLLLLAVISPLFTSKVLAAPFLPNRFIRISEPTVNFVAEYTVGFTINEVTSPLGSIELQICANTPIIADSCTLPTGLNMSSAILSNQTGNTGFTVSASTTNSVLLTRFPSLPFNAASTYSLSNITNPDTPGSYYLRIKTFSSNDGTGAHLEEGGAVYSLNGGININTEVPPYLKLCTAVVIVNYDCSTATAYLIDFGEFSKSSANSATSQIVVATNAGSGFSITIAGTTMTSGNNIINSLSSGGASSPGTAQFGINLRSNTNPATGSEPIGPGVASPTANYNVPNSFRFTSSDIIVSGSGPTDNKKFTISYLVNVDLNQPPGIYATTLTYIALANF